MNVGTAGRPVQALVSGFRRDIAQGVAESKALSNAIEIFADPQRVRSALVAALSSPRSLSEISIRSYKHVNGFDKIVLYAGHSCKVRLHVWWPDARGESIWREPIHNHRWSFASTLLAGKMEFHNFHETGEGDQYLRYSATSRGESDFYEVRPAGMSRLQLAYASVIVPGTRYVLPYGVAHRVITDRRVLTATLVIQGPAARPASDVFSPTPLAQQGQIPLPHIDVPELRAKLANIADVLNQ